MQSQKYSIEDVKKISPAVLLKIIQRAKDFLKKNKVMKEIFKDHNLDINILDQIPIRFGDLDVSAQTARGVITLNYKLLCDGDFFKDYSYLVHECQHYLDQCYGDKPTQGANDGDYLENPYEVESFQRQLEYMSDMFGKNEADNYVEHLLDHHDKDGKDRNDLKDKLMENVNDN